LLAAALLLFLPTFVSAEPIAKGVFAFCILVIVATALDFAFGPRPTTFIGRAAYLVGFGLFIDTIHVQKSQPCLDHQGTLQIVCAAAVAFFVVLVWPSTDFDSPLARFVARVLLVALFTFAMEEGTTGTVRLASAAVGRRLRPLHDAPYLSTSLWEFWGRRWNLLTAGWLRRHCFVRMVRFGAGAAMFATFVLSAAMHGYLFVSIDRAAALSWASFFLVQPVLLIAEHKLRVRRWPIPFARVWTLGCLVACLPLLAWPLLTVFDTSF
jgi:hypothetical protein